MYGKAWMGSFTSLFPWVPLLLTQSFSPAAIPPPSPIANPPDANASSSLCLRLRLCVLCRRRRLDDSIPPSAIAAIIIIMSSAAAAAGDLDRDGLWLRLWFSGLASAAPSSRSRFLLSAGDMGAPPPPLLLPTSRSRLAAREGARRRMPRDRERCRHRPRRVLVSREA